MKYKSSIYKLKGDKNMEETREGIFNIEKERSLRRQERKRDVCKNNIIDKPNSFLSKLWKREIIKLFISTVIFFCLFLLNNVYINKNIVEGINFLKNKTNFQRNIDYKYISSVIKEKFREINDKYNFNIEKYIPAISDDIKEIPTKELKEDVSTSNIQNKVESINENKEKYKVAVTSFSQIDEDINNIKKEGVIFIKPTSGKISSLFGARTSDGGLVSPYHEGIDIANKTGTKIKSSIEGVVTSVINSKSGYRKLLKNK